MMNLKTAIEIHAYGTSEGVEKAWDSRGRGRKGATATDLRIALDTEIDKLNHLGLDKARDRAVSQQRIKIIQEQLNKLAPTPTRSAPPSVLYHLTPQSRLQGISRNGIRGREQGTSPMYQSETRNYPVYSFTDRNDVGRLRDNLLDQGDISKSQGNNLVVVHYKPDASSEVHDDDEFSDVLDSDKSSGHPWAGRVVVHEGDVDPRQVVGYQKVNRDGSLGDLRQVNWGRGNRK
jgi:hypothetical protein